MGIPYIPTYQTLETHVKSAPSTLTSSPFDHHECVGSMILGITQTPDEMNPLPPLNRAYNGDPNIFALERGDLLIMGLHNHVWHRNLNLWSHEEVVGSGCRRTS